MDNLHNQTPADRMRSRLKPFIEACVRDCRAYHYNHAPHAVAWLHKEFRAGLIESGWPLSAKSMQQTELQIEYGAEPLNSQFKEMAPSCETQANLVYAMENYLAYQLKVAADEFGSGADEVFTKILGGETVRQKIMPRDSLYRPLSDFLTPQQMALVKKHEERLVENLIIYDR